MADPSDSLPAPKASSGAVIKRAGQLFRPHRAKVVWTLVAVMAGVVLGLLPPWFLQVIIDEGLIGRNLDTVVLFSILTVIVNLVAAGVTLLYGFWGVQIGQAIMCELRGRLYRHLQGMSLSFFTATRTGEIQTRLISDIGGVQNVVSTTLTDAVSNLAIVVSTLVAMFVFDWRLTLLSIALIPLFGWIGQKVGDFARDVRKGSQEQTAELNAMMQETLSVSGILLTKTTGRQDVLFEKFDVENVKLADWQIKLNVLQYLFFGMIRMITSLSPALVYWLAGWLMIAHGDPSLTVGKLVAFTALQIRLFFPLTGIMGTHVELLSSVALFERIFEYLDLKQEVVDRPDPVKLDSESVQGDVRFDDVTFRYDPATEKPSLDRISFSASPGQLVALVGPSGAGKTTITYLIPRLYDVESGSVKIDGVDVRDIEGSSLSRVVGAVTQETYLLHSSVRENLKVAKPDATDAEMVEACRLAAIHDHIESLEQGYDTVVGERGYKLSGGEKQRLAIARAILKNPRILILDEATSALDTETERLIQSSLNRLMKGRTTFAIAHRLSTVIAADLILVVQDGRIVEQGRHQELLARGGLYRKLHEEQFKSEGPLAGEIA
ncbi:MAG: ABC transporter ATP-binding protein [Fimbriimonadaceae bacterium]|nr:ABC transporter ATP-binding protein [Fimbriimonadaceae bacterium]QYK58332.1 MAG: ABC transporter ATP-binding protein [Fimbriimonadaceae bacterium]